MTGPTDTELMREFADHQSEAAFAQLLQRHLNLVYSVALRLAGNPHDAQDITQAVFVILARKLPALRHRATLTGWLYETTRFTARQLLRTRIRQQTRDQNAFMQSTLDPSATDDAWRQLAPHLEAAMSRLAVADRALLALRFYENKTAAETAALLGIGEHAAHKRTARALEKLRKFFSRRGTVLSAALIAAALSANAVQAAPAGLASTLTASTAQGVALAATTATLVQTTLNALLWSKFKIVLGTAAAALVLGTALVAVSHKIDSPKPIAAATSPADTALAAAPIAQIIREPLNDSMTFALETPPGAVALQPDGKIIVGSTLFGRFIDETTGAAGFYTRGAFRLNADGSLDRSFFCDVQVPASAAQMSHVDYLPDGRIFLSGLFGSIAGKPRPDYAMLLPDGSLDESFEPWRGATNQPEPFFVRNVTSPTIWKLTSYQGGAVPAAWLPDNSVAIVCRSIDSPNPIYSPMTSYRLDATGAWLRPTNKILSSGVPRQSDLVDKLGPNGFWPNIMVNWTRETADTNLPYNQRFSEMYAREAAQKLSAIFEEMPIELCSYAVKLPDGGAILAVVTPENIGGRVGPGEFMRFDKNWKRDFTFTNHYDARGCLNLKRQKDGKILVAGMYGTFNGEDFPGLVRLNQDGSTDRTFHCVTTNTPEGRVMNMAIQDDGRIVICGFFSTVNGTEVPHIARLNPDGSLDQTFHTSFLTQEKFNDEFRKRRRVRVVQLAQTKSLAPATSTAPPAAATAVAPARMQQTIMITTMKLLESGAGAYLEFTGTANQPYILQANDSLGAPNWTNLSTNQANANGFGTFIDPAAPTHPRRFYRIATP